MKEEMIRFPLKAVCVAAMCLIFWKNGYPQLGISAADVPYLIDFDSGVPGVLNGAFQGSGFDPGPVSGQLDSDAWSGTGMSEGDLPFGGTASMGDWARGASTGGETQGGLYAFEVATADYSLGVQPTGSDFNPGTITLRIRNDLPADIVSLTLSYEIWTLNNADRSSNWRFAYSPDDVSYVDLPAVDFASPALADPTPVWTSTGRNTVISGLNIPPGAFFYLRWTSEDNGGSGSRDELAIDDISLTASASCSIYDLQASPSACSGTSNQFILSFSTLGGSGNYQAQDVNTGMVYGSGNASPIALTVPLSCGSVDVKVVDAGNPACESPPLTVALQYCASSPVIITEVADPDDEPLNGGRFVEICNRGNAGVDISDYELIRYANGNTTGASIAVPGTVVLAPGECFVFVYTTHPYSLSCNHVLSGLITGNGNDAYELTDGNCVLDIYGEVGVDGTGTLWEYTDGVAVRLPGVSSGSTVWNPAEWSIAAPVVSVSMTPCGDYACGEYYRSATSGDWTSHSSWEVSPDGFNWSTASPGCVPTYSNSVSIEIRTGHTVSLNAELPLDQLTINGTLTLGTNGGIQLNDHPGGVDMILNGTLEDHAILSYGFEPDEAPVPGGTWQIGPAATLIATNSSASFDYNQYYHNGASNMPPTAHFIYRYTGAGTPAFATFNCYYPNLTFENTSGAFYDWNDFTHTWGSDGLVILGDLTIGTGNKLYNNIDDNNWIVEVQGDFHLAAGSELTNFDIQKGTGQGFIVHGDVHIDGTLDLSHGSGNAGLLRFEQGSIQQLTGNGPILLRNLTVQKTSGYVNLQRDLTVSHQLSLQNRNIRTNAHTLTLAPGCSIAGGHANSYVQTNATGYLKQQVLGPAFFPIGNSSYNPAELINGGTVDQYSMRVFDQVLESGHSGFPLQADVVDRSWVVKEDLSGGSLLEMKVQWNTAEELSGFQRSACYVSMYDVGWSEDAPSPAVSVGSGNYTRSRTGITNLDMQETEFAVASNGVLPVELTRFEATRKAQTIQLSWTTATERRNDHFRIERSSDAHHFEVIGQVAGAGTSLQVRQYEWVDKHPRTGLSYYRLRQVDVDGKTTLSPVRVVEFPGGCRVYPNPARERVWLELDQPLVSALRVSLYSAFGREVRRLTLPAAKQRIEIELKGLGPGLYYLCLGLKGNPEVIPIIKQ